MSEGDPPLREVVWGYGYRDSIPKNDSNAVPTKLAGQMGVNVGSCLRMDEKVSSWENFRNLSINFD